MGEGNRWTGRGPGHTGVRASGLARPGWSGAHGERYPETAPLSVSPCHDRASQLPFLLLPPAAPRSPPSGCTEPSATILLPVGEAPGWQPPPAAVWSTGETLPDFGPSLLKAGHTVHCHPSLLPSGPALPDNWLSPPDSNAGSRRACGATGRRGAPAQNTGPSKGRTGTPQTGEQCC